MEKLKKTLNKYTEEAIALPDKFFENIPQLNPNQSIIYSEDIPVYSGMGNIVDTKNWRRICQEDLIDVQWVYPDEPKWGFLFYTNDGDFYYSLKPQEFNEYSETFAGEFLDKM